MQQNMPGITVGQTMQGSAEDYLDSLFSAGGLVLSQVLELTGLNTHTVQNWVKRKFVEPPVAKKYGRDQFCTIVLLNMFGTVFYLDEIKDMIGMVENAGGPPNCLYLALADTLALLPPDAISHATQLQDIIAQALGRQQLSKKLAGTLAKIIHVFILAHLSSLLKADAYALMDAL